MTSEKVPNVPQKDALGTLSFYITMIISNIQITQVPNATFKRTLGTQDTPDGLLCYSIVCSPRPPNHLVRLFISVSITSNPIPAANPFRSYVHPGTGTEYLHIASQKEKSLLKSPDRLWKLNSRKKSLSNYEHTSKKDSIRSTSNPSGTQTKEPGEIPDSLPSDFLILNSPTFFGGAHQKSE